MGFFFMQQMNFKKSEPLVMSIGGSLVVPNGGPNSAFLESLQRFVEARISAGRRLVLVVGGGKTARHYIDAAAKIQAVDRDDLDWLGIHSSRLNGHLLRTVFRDVAHPVVIKNPLRTPAKWQGKVLVAAGWKPGWSTDYVASRIAKCLGVNHIINASNIDYVFDADPAKVKTAKPLKEIAWSTYRKMVGDVWDPGLSAPFDPVASRFCQRHKIDVAIVNGADMNNIARAVKGETFKGTIIHS